MSHIVLSSDTGGLSHAVAFRYLPPRELCGREVFPPVAGPATVTLLEAAADVQTRTQTQTQSQTQSQRVSGRKAGGDEDADEEKEEDEVAPVAEPPTRARAPPQSRANDRAAQDL